MAVSREIKVGLFVFLGFVGAAAIVFLIGDNRSLFDAKVPFHAQFADVQGVKPGSTVRMGGVDIGSVSRVQYPDDPGNTLISVNLSIVKREAPRIRQSSLAGIAAKGLLGDKMVTISPGKPDEAALAPDSLIPSAPAEDFTQVLSQVGSLTQSARGVLTNLETATGTLAEAEFRDDLRQGVHALSQILVSLDSREGYAGRLLHDEGEAKRLSGVIANLERTTARLDGVLAGVDQVIDRIQTGPGLAHEVLYGDSKAVAQFGNAADEVSKTLAGIREGNGLAHGLLYGDDGRGGDSALGDQLAGDMAGMSQDLRAMVSDMRQGKGTLGALLVDPSVYEDLKMLLGNVQRNQTLRALVRYSIQRDDGPPGVQVVDPSDGKSDKREKTVRDEPAPTPPAPRAKRSV
ncbi:MAG TPA: MlaD family protein, partial [Polyangiaceae bacterium]|nr:MlaD family protein [Polyangiaceae bacterium]